jgi:LysR family transcriptional regulator, glycine cleavage system transcriptional activator
MQDLPFRLPPLNAIRVFRAVMAQRSFRRASDELRVSPQAVSQQIKTLENSLAVSLFDRKGRSIEPTEAAILFAHYVDSAFAELAEGVRRVTKAGPRPRVNVNASPYFATRYLLDRLSRFRERMPDADLRLTTIVELPDFVADDVDVAVQWGYGGWKPYEQILLVRDYKELCCTPELAARINEPEDLLGLPLLHPVLSKGLWRDVLRHLGVNGIASGKDMQLEDAATMRRAAIAGLGVGLLSEVDAREEIALGRLVAPLGFGVMRQMSKETVPGFFLVFPKAHRRVPAVAAFCTWVEKEDWSELK